MASAGLETAISGNRTASDLRVKPPLGSATLKFTKDIPVEIFTRLRGPETEANHLGLFVRKSRSGGSVPSVVRKSSCYGKYLVLLEHVMAAGGLNPTKKLTQY